MTDPNPAWIGKNRWLVRTNCHECFIDIEHSEKGGSGWISVSLLSTHGGWWAGTWGARLKAVWSILRGHAPWWLDINTAEEADALAAVLGHARIAAFGYPPFIGASLASPNTSDNAFASIEIEV